MFSKKFVAATREYASYDRPVSAPYMRRNIELARLTQSATLTVTCTGFYRLWVNGTEKTATLFAPGITNPDQILFYDTYDLRADLKPGRNVLAFQLGNGMADCMGGFLWDFDKAAFRGAPALAFALETDGTVTEADERVKCAPSPVFFDDLRGGEFYDANRETPGWNGTAFDDGGWTDAIPVPPARGEAMPRDAEPVRVLAENRAVKVIRGRMKPQDPARIKKEAREFEKTAFYSPDEKEEGFIFCFENNRACLPKLRIRGRAGQRIVLQAAEFCTEDGEMDDMNIQCFYPRGFAQRDIYICKGGDIEEYVPSFTYHGARYIMVIGAAEDQIAPDTVTQLVMNSDLRTRGHFSCSDETANRLQHAAMNSVFSNFVFFPTDCPHREKNGWTGDASMSAEYVMQNIAPERSWRQWMKMIARAQRLDGALPGIIPTTGWGFHWGNGPVFDQVITELPYQAYLYQGDLSLFEETADSVMRYLNYAANIRDKYGLLAYGLGDWMPAGRRGGENFRCPLEVTSTAIVYRMAKNAAFLFEKSGRHTQAVFAETLAEELRAAFRTRLIDFDSMLVRGECQTAQAAALYYGMAEKGEAEGIYRQLVRLVHEKDDHADCGMLGLRIVFRTLAARGDTALAWKMITREDMPGYGRWVNAFGLTALPESFHETLDGESTSLNHHFFGDFSGLFIANVAGLQINPYRDDPGYVRIAPDFIASLTCASADYETVRGQVAVRWERENGLIAMTIEKADGVDGEIRLPRGASFVSIPGKTDAWAADRRECPLTAGRYLIRQ